MRCIIGIMFGDQLLFLLQQATGSRPSTLETQLVCFLRNWREGNSGDSSGGRVWMGCISCMLLDSCSLITNYSSSTFFFFLRTLPSLSALQAGEISSISSTRRLQFSKKSFSLSLKEVSFLKMRLSILGLILILVTPERSVHSWQRSLKRSLMVLRKWLQMPSWVMSLRERLEQQAQKRRQICRFLIMPWGFSASGMCMKDLKSSTQAEIMSMSQRHLHSSKTYSRKSSSKRLSSSFLASVHRKRSMKKVRKRWSVFSRKEWQARMAIRWMISLILSSNWYFSYSRHSCAYRWASVITSSALGSSLNALSFWKPAKRLPMLEERRKSGAPWEELRDMRRPKGISPKMSELLETRMRFLPLAGSESQDLSILEFVLICEFMIIIEKNGCAFEQGVQGMRGHHSSSSSNFPWFYRIWFFSLLHPSYVASMMNRALHRSLIASARFSSIRFQDCFFSRFWPSFLSGRFLMYRSRRFFSFSRMALASSFSRTSRCRSPLTALRPMVSSSMCISRLWSFSLTKSMRWVQSSLGSSCVSAMRLAFFQMLVSISLELICSTSSFLCSSSFSFSSRSFGILFRLVSSHFSISSPPGGCWLEISCSESVTTESEDSCSFSSTLVFTLLTVYSLLPSATPTICAMMQVLLLVPTVESMRYLTKHPFTSYSKRRELSRSTILLRVRVRGRMWSPRLLMEGTTPTAMSLKMDASCREGCFSLISPSSSEELCAWQAAMLRGSLLRLPPCSIIFRFRFSSLCCLQRSQIFCSASTIFWHFSRMSRISSLISSQISSSEKSIFCALVFLGGRLILAIQIQSSRLLSAQVIKISASEPLFCLFGGGSAGFASAASLDNKSSMSSQPIYFSTPPPPIITQYLTHISLAPHPRQEKQTSRGKDMARRHFSDYQNGRKMISELPKFKCKASRDRLQDRDYGQSFKLPHRDGTQSQMYQKIEKFFTRTVQQIEKIQKDRYEAHSPKKQSEREIPPISPDGKMRITRASRSLEVPNLLQRDLGMTREASFYLSRRKQMRLKTDGSYRSNTNMRQLIKQRKKEERDNLLGIIEGLTVEKKELISGKTQKDLINKNKLLNYPKKNKSFFRALDSRIQPWSFFANDADHDHC